MSSLRFWWHEGVAEAGATPDQVRADGETQTNPDFIFSFPSFPPFPPFLAHLELPPRLFPRRRHLAPGLFFPSLFGSAPSSRTNAAPINNRGSCSLPLPPSLGSVFLSPCLSLLLPGGDARKSRSGGLSSSMSPSSLESAASEARGGIFDWIYATPPNFLPAPSVINS